MPSRQPSVAAKAKLKDVVADSGKNQAFVRSLLKNDGFEVLEQSVDWSGATAQWVSALVETAAGSGQLDDELVSTLQGVAQARTADFDAVRVFLEVPGMGASVQLFGEEELKRAKKLALDAGLHQPYPHSQLANARLPRELRRHSARSLDKAEQVRAWIDAANRQQVVGNDEFWMTTFVDAGLELSQRPEVNAEPLRTFKALLASKGLGAAFSASTPAGQDDGLEKTIVANGIEVDSAVFRERWAEAERRICAIYIRGTGYGTGFLVGPDLVLTCHHVLSSIIGGNDPEVEFVFDKVTGKPRVTAELASGLAKNPRKWLLDSSPQTDAETLSTSTLEDAPDLSHMDHCLVRIDQRLGDERGWFRLRPAEGPPFSFPTVAALIILGHPQYELGELREQIWSIERESVIAVGPKKRRVRYRTNTQRGSSGSPVFNLQWELVAMHHLGRKSELFNQGIPTAAIAERPEMRAALGAS